MRAWIITGAILCAVATGAHAEEQPPVYPVFFVAVNGNDAWSGMLPDPAASGDDGPFATLQRAQQALREMAQEDGHPHGATVHVRGGTYHLLEPIVLEAKDSGRENRPVMFRNYKSEEVRIIGGVAVSAWESVEGEVKRAKVSDLLPEGASPKALYWNGKRQTLARWPNAGGGDLPGGEWTFVKASDNDSRSRRFFYQGDKAAAWEGLEGVQISIWPNYNWWQTIVPVASIADGAVTLAEDLPYTIEPGRRYFYQNIRAELDVPGEWHYDAAGDALDFWPPSPDEAEVIIPVATSLFRIEGGSHINLWGFTLEMALGEAVTMTNAHGCMLAKSIVRNVDEFGVKVSGGAQCRILGNDIYATGRGGIDLAGGDRKTLTFANHQAVNNRIHDFGVLYQTYQTGINVSGVGNTLSNNLIHDAPHIGILLNGNEHIIEYNEIHHVCMQGSDNGGFYMGRDWTQRGNKIRYNKFHDIYGFGLAHLGPDKDGNYPYESPHQAWAVYLDDCSSGTTIYGNWFYRVPLCGVMIGGGRDNVVENNVFVDCIPALHIDDRWDEYPWDVMHERLKAMNPEEPPYSERYPELLTMGDDPRKPENNRFERNVIYYGPDNFKGLSTTAPSSGNAVVYDLDQFDPETTVINNNLIYHDDQPIRVAWSEYGKSGTNSELSWEEWQAKGFDVDSLIADPLFVEPERDNFRLRPDSPALKLKWENIPAHRMGLIEDEFRVSPVPPPDPRRDGMEHKSYPVRLE